ncbi:MAG TPA: PilZ domain-containing protein [Malonomonas sp.]
MLYQRYFKNGQKLLLNALDRPDNDIRTELLSATLEGGEGDLFTLCLPYSADATEQYPFVTDMPFEISSEALGLGIRVTGNVEKKIDGKRLSMKINSDLQMFQRRNQPRLDCKLGIRISRGQGSLKALRATWEKNIQVLQSPNAPTKLEGFHVCPLNLSSGGIRFALRAPVNPAELCLMLIDLQQSKPPICALAEVVWARPEQDESIISSGMRFINILAADQKRIDSYIANPS